MQKSLHPFCIEISKYFYVGCLFILLNGRILGLQQTVKFEAVPLFDYEKNTTVYDITQDSVGYMWFASKDGIFRYNGYNFKYIPLENDSTVTWASKVLMTVDPQGDLWYIYQKTLYKYNQINESFESHRIPIEKNGLRFFAITSDSSSIWLGSNNGVLYRIDKKTFRINIIPVPSEKEKLFIYNLLIADSVLWFTSGSGLYKYSSSSVDVNKKPIKINFPDENNEGLTRGLLIDNDANLFFGSIESKLNKFSQNELQRYDWSNKRKPNHGEYGSKINSMCFDNDQNIWIASSSAGVIFFNRQTDTFSSSCIDTALFQGLKSAVFEKIFIDKSGIVWVSRAGQGIFRSVLPPFSINNYETIINPKDSCKNDYITHIAELSNGEMVFSIDQNGLLFFNPKYNTFKFIKHETGKTNTLPCNDITAMICDKNDNLWLGSTSGLIQYDVNHHLFRQYLPNPDELRYQPITSNKNYISSIQAFSDSILWISTNDAIYKFNKSQKIFNEKYSTDSLSYIVPEKFIQQKAKPVCLGKDKNNILWVGTATAGIFLFDPEKKQFINHYLLKRTPYLPIIISDIFYDSKNQIWVSSLTSGIYSFNNTTNTFTNYSNKQGVISDKINKIVEDSLSNIWLCCPKGVMLLDQKTHTFTSFNQQDNFNFCNLEKNDWHDSSIFIQRHNNIIVKEPETFRYKNYTVSGYTSRDGTLYFAGPNGFTQIRPDFLSRESDQRVYLSAFRIFNEPVLFDKPIYQVKKIKLNYKDHIFSFEFLFTNFSNVSRNKFAYWLKGFEKDWQYTNSNNTREYINLPPGKYTMLVKACSAHGIWTKKPLSIDIIITPPYWQTWWFRITIGLVTLGLIGLIFWLRIRNIQRQKNLLEIQVRERTKELHKSNEQLIDEIRFRQKAEEELRKSEEEYRDLFENAYDVIWISDLKGNIQAVNHYLATLIGYSRNEIIGKNLLNFIIPEHRFRAIRCFKKFQKNGFYEGELNFKTRKNGIRILWIKIRAIKDNETIVGIHGIGRDSTELRKTQAELQEAERMKRESIKQLILKIAHEIKNPLASISSSAQLVASSKDSRESPKIQRHMNIINKSVNTCNQVIRELYTFTHKPVINFKPFQIDELMDSILASTENRLATLPDIKLVVKQDISKAYINGDKFRLEQALMNLVNNAIDAMTDKGILTMHLYRADHQIHIDIADTGCGIPPESIEKLYTPFFTSKSTGFGLGMSIVMDIIDGHHAKISVKSEVSKGTTFTISFNEVKIKEGQ